MSTRSVIGRIDGDTFAGRYHHTDGYPTALGALFVKRALAADDLEAFLAYIVDEHSAGWSSLWDDRCYCHWAGRDSDRDDLLRACDLSIQWAYGIDAASRTLGIFCAVRDPAADDGYGTQLVSVVPLDGPIDWAAIESRGSAIKDAAR